MCWIQIIILMKKRNLYETDESSLEVIALIEYLCKSTRTCPADYFSQLLWLQVTNKPLLNVIITSLAHSRSLMLTKENSRQLNGRGSRTRSLSLNITKYILIAILLMTDNFYERSSHSLHLPVITTDRSCDHHNRWLLISHANLWATQCKASHVTQLETHFHTLREIFLNLTHPTK